MYKNKNKRTNILYVIIILSLSIFTSYNLLLGTGASTTTLNIILFASFIMLFSISQKTFYFVVFPIIFIHIIYMPIGQIYGAVTHEFLIAALSSDARESLEFSKQFMLADFYKASFAFISLFIIKFLIHKTISIQSNNNIRIIYVILITILFVLNLPPFIYPKQIINATQYVYHEYQKLKQLTYMNPWENASLNRKTHNTYVLIIGESARRDYHHAYGYSINNTPFMSKSAGVLVEGLTAGGKTTVPSLRVMLNKTDSTTWEPDYGFNIINLAKAAGIRTYWLSNQGYFGTHDTPISAIAQNSNESYFLKYGDYNSKNTKDVELLPKFLNILEQNNISKKLIVLHLYGSHYNACDRINEDDLIINSNQYQYQYINCYISSIKNTDSLIEQIYTILMHKNENFSILYFADHGLVHKDHGPLTMDLKQRTGITLANYEHPSQFHYDVPLFNISSDSSQQIKCKSFKSPTNFLNGLANWIGITATQLNPNYSLFDCANDPIENTWKHLKKVQYDPAIDISIK